MEIDEIRKELNHLLENILDHSSRYSDERPIPSLEISFVMAKINKMQENLAVLRHLLEEQELAAKNEKPTDQVVEERMEEPAPVEEEKIEESIPTEDENEAPQEESASQNSVEESSSSAKLTDLLTLNDRYLFANELFNKDMNEFNNLVKKIDLSSSLSEAQSLCATFEWDDENEHVVSFYSIVERRFS
jgi:hypothetical protein